MKKGKEELTDKLTLQLPIYGIILFFTLYFIATLFYPGGSNLDKHAEGFSWMNNYWCNLVKGNAINGETNLARPFAALGTLILSIAMSVFWYIYPSYMKMGKVFSFVLRFSGPITMIFILLLLTKLDHDSLTITASLFGLVAIACTFIGLIKRRWYGLIIFGMLNIFLIWLNNYLYFRLDDTIYLPVVQKITFASFLFWICSIDYSILQLIKARKAKL